MTAPTWTPEREISLSLASRLIRGYPELADASVAPFAQGWDNTAFLASRSGGEDLVFRFPRRAIALPGIRRELASLPRWRHCCRGDPGAQFQGSGSRPGRRWAAEGAEPWPFWGAAMCRATNWL